MTFEQRAWAHGHDWFIRTSKTLGVIVRDDNGEELEFIDFKELRTWAGY